MRSLTFPGRDHECRSFPRRCKGWRYVDPDGFRSIPEHVACEQSCRATSRWIAPRRLLPGASLLRRSVMGDHLVISPMVTMQSTVDHKTFKVDHQNYLVVTYTSKIWLTSVLSNRKRLSCPTTLSIAQPMAVGIITISKPRKSQPIL